MLPRPENLNILPKYVKNADTIKNPKAKAEAHINFSKIMCETNFMPRQINRGVERIVSEAAYSNTYRNGQQFDNQKWKRYFNKKKCRVI